MLEDQLSQKVIFNAKEIAEAFAHIEEVWPRLTVDQKEDKGTLIGLPHPFIVPSEEGEGFVMREMYYWDSYFVAIALLQAGYNDLAEGMLENLIHLAKRFDIIPNTSRFYQTSRSQPPILTSYIFEVYDQIEKSDEWLRERIAVAEKEYRIVWTANEQPNVRNVHKGLSRNYQIDYLHDLAETESGWDMTTRFAGKILDHVAVDLNSLLYKYETDFARAYKIFGQEDTAEVWLERASLRKQTMYDELWDNDTGFYFDLNFKNGKHSIVWSLAAYYTMWLGIADQDQAKYLVENLQKFLYEGGLSTTSSGPHEDQRDISWQWAYPNGWAPLHYIVCEGLVRYGYQSEAENIARRWLKTCLEYYKNYGAFRETYNVVSPNDPPQKGVYPHQTGFAWTNAVFIDLAKKFLSDEELALV